MTRWLLILIEPMGLTFLALLGLTVLLWRRKQRGLAGWALGLAGFIMLIGGTDFPGALMRSLERPYAGVKIAELPACDAIVILGGGLQPSRLEAAGLHLTMAADRVVMGLELARLGKARVLVLGGGASELDGAVLSEADLLRDAIAARGLADAELISLGACRDTRDEALGTAKLARERGWRRVLLVTSAFHMRRAEATFRTAGVNVVPAPCNFLTTLGTEPAAFAIAPPSYGGFMKMSRWMHEQIGWLVYRRRGWVE